MVTSWIIMGMLVFVVIIFYKMEHNQKVKIVSAIIIGFLLYFSALTLFSSNEVNLNSPGGVVNAVYLYAGWIGQTASSLWNVGTDTVTMVGDAIKVNISEERRRR